MKQTKQTIHEYRNCKTQWDCVCNGLRYVRSYFFFIHLIHTVCFATPHCMLEFVFIFLCQFIYMQHRMDFLASELVTLCVCIHLMFTFCVLCVISSFFFFTSFYALFFHLHCQLLYVCVVMFCTMESFSFFSFFSFIHYDYMRLYIWLLEHIVVLDFLDVGNSRISYVTIEIVCFLVTLVCNKHTTSHVITIKLS